MVYSFSGHSIAELQVTGVKANFTKRPYDTSTSLMIHSLLVVDAMQTFGPDFELLVASHKSLWYVSLQVLGISAGFANVLF